MAPAKAALATTGSLKKQYLLGVERRKAHDKASSASGARQDSHRPQPLPVKSEKSADEQSNSLGSNLQLEPLSTAKPSSGKRKNDSNAADKVARKRKLKGTGPVQRNLMDPAPREKLKSPPKAESTPDLESAAASVASVYLAMGLKSNRNAGKKMLDTPFPQKVEQVRSLYHYHNCPPRPRPGVPKSPEFLAWEDEATKILGNADRKHTPFSNIQWAIFGSNRVFNLWMELCNSYAKGRLPDKDGVVRPAKQGRIVHSGFFRNLEGDLPETQILSILSDVKAHKILFAKTQSKMLSRCNKDSINEAAAKYKDHSFTQHLLLCKLKAEIPSSTTEITTWEKLVHKCGAIEQDFQLLQSLLDPEEIKNKTKTPSPELVTESCASFLHRLWRETVPSAVCSVTEVHNPFHVLFVKEKENCLRTGPPPRIKYPTCQLAIVDLTATTVHPWSVSAISSLVKTVHSIFSTRWFQFVFLLSPTDRISMTSVFEYLFKPPASNPYQMEFDYGSFQPHQPMTSTAMASFAPVLIVRAFISSAAVETWESIVRGRWEYSYEYNAELDKDIVPEFNIATIQQGLEDCNRGHVLIGGVEKTPLQIRHEILGFFPPHHSMCGLPSTMRSGTLFPSHVGEDIILKNSNPKDIIIDCFSRGWVSKVALLNDRECAVFTTSKQEFQFLEMYLPLLKEIDTAKAIFESAAHTSP